MSSDRKSRRLEVAGVPFDFITQERVLARIEHWRQTGQRHLVVVNNPNAVMWCHQDDQMRRATLEAGLALPDGVGVVVAALLVGHHRQHRVTGPSLMLYLCDKARALGYRHYFYGGGEGVAQRLAQRLCEWYPGLRVAGIHCPPFRQLTLEEDADAVRRINAARPDILWIGLGCPKQERWMIAHAGRIHATATIGIGAAFDFHSGNIRWAPPWVRKCGMEWLYRLGTNPGRMWHRNIRGLHFAGLVALQSMRHHLWPDPAVSPHPIRQHPAPAPIPAPVVTRPDVAAIRRSGGEQAPRSAAILPRMPSPTLSAPVSRPPRQAATGQLAT